MLRRHTAVLLAVLATGAVGLSACVTPEQAARNDAKIARDAASKEVVLQACYPVSEAEAKNAESILGGGSGGDSVYWYWRASLGTMLAKVNATSTVDLTSSCMKRMAEACEGLGLEPSSGYVSRRQAAGGQGAFTVKCSPKLEQS